MGGSFTTFLDAAYWGDPKTSSTQQAQAITGALKATGAVGVAFYIGGDNALHATDPGAVAIVLKAGYQGLAIYVPALDHNGTVDGQAAVAAAHRYNLPAGFKVCVDIEPSNFNRAGLVFSKAYSNAWHDVVHAAGFSPGPYGTPATVADCADHADYIWIAEPGQPDPTLAGLNPTFCAGRRMIQFGNGNANGVSYDLNHSQIPLCGGSPMPDPITLPAGWHGPISIGGKILGSSVTAWSPGRLDVFVRGTDDALWHVWYADDVWQPWEQLTAGGTVLSAPSVGSWSAGRLDVFYQGADGSLQQLFYQQAPAPATVSVADLETRLASLEGALAAVRTALKVA